MHKHYVYGTQIRAQTQYNQPNDRPRSPRPQHAYASASSKRVYLVDPLSAQRRSGTGRGSAAACVRGGSLHGSLFDHVLDTRLRTPRSADGLLCTYSIQNIRVGFDVMCCVVRGITCDCVCIYIFITVAFCVCVVCEHMLSAMI